MDTKRGHLLSARERFGQALAIHRDLGNPAGVAQACYSLAMAHLWLGRLDEARDMVAEALDRDRQVGSRRGLAYDLAASSMLQQQLGKISACAQEHGGAPNQARAVIEIATTGKTKSVLLQPANLNSTPLGTCIRNVLSIVTFPTSKEEMKVSVEIKAT